MDAVNKQHPFLGFDRPISVCYIKIIKLEILSRTVTLLLPFYSFKTVSSRLFSPLVPSFSSKRHLKYQYVYLTDGSAQQTTVRSLSGGPLSIFQSTHSRELQPDAYVLPVIRVNTFNPRTLASCNAMHRHITARSSRLSIHALSRVATSYLLSDAPLPFFQSTHSRELQRQKCTSSF